MPDAYRVRITPRALHDLEQIFGYIRADSPQNASSMIARLMDGIFSLDVFPHRFDAPRSHILPAGNIRIMPIQPYLVRYRIDDFHKLVFIMRVSHGARRRP